MLTHVVLSRRQEKVLLSFFCRFVAASVKSCCCLDVVILLVPSPYIDLKDSSLVLNPFLFNKALPVAASKKKPGVDITQSGHFCW